MCGGLSKNDPYRLILYICVLRPILSDGLLLEELGGVSLLEEVCCWGWDLKFQKPMPGLVSFSACCLWIRNVSSKLLLHAMPTGFLP